MSALGAARMHLAKAREFLTAAELALDLELFNAAASNAVISGINSKDAICLRLTGRSTKADDHSSAVAELRAAGGTGPHGAATRQAATTLGRLLKMKSRSQYQTIDVAPADATTAVESAQRLLVAATDIVRG